MYNLERDLTISEKEEIMRDINYALHRDYKYKINMEPLQVNILQECYRDQLVSYFQMTPLINKTVRLEEADYIVYAHPYARIEDFSWDVLEDLERINQQRKEGSEIIIVGKATNIKSEIEGKYKNITYVPSHYTEYLGKRFDIDMKDEYVVYDDRYTQLNIWPVDGCQNKCGFCRRTYMHIPFESLPIEYIKERLDYFQKNHPEQMKYVSLRAENLTQYGLDIYGKPMLHKLIELLDSYDEIKYIEMPIGMCIGEITPEILNVLCQTKKIASISLNLEAGSNRLLNVIGKKHSRESAIHVCEMLRKAHPNLDIKTTIMVGLPTEELEDMIELADLIIKCQVNYVHCNYYGHSPKNHLAVYPQLSDNLRELHLAYLIKLLKKNYNNEWILTMRHEKISNKSKRSVVRKLERLKEKQKYCLPRLLDVVYENFVGCNMSIKEKDNVLKIDDDFELKLKKVFRAQQISKRDQEKQKRKR